MTSQGSPLDLARFEMISGGDKHFQRELMIVFLDGARDVLFSLNDASPSGSAWRNALHRLKGAALNLGLLRLADVIQLAEQEKNALMADSHRQVLQLEMEESRKVLEKAVAGRGSIRR